MFRYDNVLWVNSNAFRLKKNPDNFKWMKCPGPKVCSLSYCYFFMIFIV